MASSERTVNCIANGRVAEKAGQVVRTELEARAGVHPQRGELGTVDSAGSELNGNLADRQIERHLA
jgi:hypothetical protein